MSANFQARGAWHLLAIRHLQHVATLSAGALSGLVILLSLALGQVRADEPDQATREGWQKMSQLGDGFVIWESDRSGRWRLYRRELDGSGLRQISPDEPGRDHFCPHLSPDGSKLVYLSYPAGSDTYQQSSPQDVQIHLIHNDGSQDTRIVNSARAYFEDRGAVWVDNAHLIYIDGNGFTQQLDLNNGSSTKLTHQGLPAGGFLMNATKSHATTGTPTFSLFDASRSEITTQNGLNGCQPYFTHDGRWGFWMGGAGGPINRIDLQSRQVTPIINQDDPRMPKERNYLYFPMISRDGRMFAFAASPDQHDHFKSDYDIYLAPMNPKTLELTAKPVRYSFDQGTDRFPDVYVAPSQSTAAVESPSENSDADDSSSTWPANPDGLVYVFETAQKPNLVPSNDGRPSGTYNIQPRGRARLDHNQAMVLSGGAFLVEGADQTLLDRCRQSNQLTVEAVVRPDHLDQSGPARIVTFSSNAVSRNFTLGQERDKLVFRLRTPQTGENGVNPEVTLCQLAPQRRTHIAVTYRPGQLTAYVNGKQVFQGQNVQGNFSNWQPQHLLFGDEFDGKRDWAGTLEGIAIFNRALDPEEVQRNARRYRKLMRDRSDVPRIEVTARLIEKSHVPTLEEVKPYRAALVVSKYQISNVHQGSLDGREVFVAEWALLDGETQPINLLQPGQEVRITLEPLEENHQLQQFVCQDDFNSDDDLLAPRYYNATP